MSQYVILGGGRARRVWCGRVVDWRTRGRVETGSAAVVWCASLSFSVVGETGRAKEIRGFCLGNSVISRKVSGDTLIRPDRLP